MIAVDKIYFYLSLFLIISLFSCKKETDETAPKITFNTPIANQTFNVNGYVTVNATVTDDTKITAVSVSLLDANEHLVHLTIPVSVSSPSMTINMQYYLDNIHLLSGIYNIKITASDGKNDAHKYQKIYLIEVPKNLSTVYVVTNTSNAQTNLSTIDATFSSVVPFHSFPGDYQASSISNYYQQAYLCGNYTGNFSGHILQYNSPRFSIAPVISANPYFTGYFNDDYYCYVSRYDGNIKGYDYSGSIIYGANALSGYYAQHLCFNDGYLIAEEIDALSSAKKIVTYFPTGSIEKNCLMSQDVVQFCEKDISNVFVFGNIAGQAVVQLFDRSANNLWSPYPFSLAAGSLLSALKIDADTYLLGHSNGTIYKYQYSMGSVTTYLTGYTAVKMKYDDVNNKLYVVEANRVQTFDYGTAVLANTVNTSENILDIHLLYNR